MTDRIFLIAKELVDLDDTEIEMLNNNDFIAIAEEQGNVFSKEGFVESWNGCGTVDIPHDSVLRIITL